MGWYKTYYSYKILATLALMFLSGGLLAHIGDGQHFADTLIVACEPDYPPYCMVDENGDADGFSVELFRAAALAAGLEADIKIGIWNIIMKDLAEGRIDALPLAGRTPERESLFDFTMPYLLLHGAIFVREDDNGIRKVEDLKGKEIVVMKSDNAEEYVRREKISDKIFTTNTFEEAFRQLANGQYDAVITQRITGIELLKSMDIKSVKPLEIPLPDFRQDFCFAVQKGNQPLLDRLNEGLSIVIANNTYENIRYKWFGPDVEKGMDYYDVQRILLLILIPLILMIILFWNVFLRKEVKRRTRKLNQEIDKHKHTLAILEKEKMRSDKSEKALINLKEGLERLVAERTFALEEKVQKLNNSQKAMLYMVEDLNRITAELNEKRARLELSNRELEAFTYSVSHDLRAPLRAINGFAAFLSEDYADKLDDEGKRFIAIIRTNASRMDQLITDMLNLSRISRAEIQATKVDMRALVISMFQEIASPAEKDSFELVIDDLPHANCDATLMKQVWQNLLSNALKYSGKASIKKIEISAIVHKDVIDYCIKDYGAGFNDQYVDKIFGLFQRLHKESEYKGTGVGLAIVQRIIHRHNGQVWAEGKINQGAKFCFSIPIM